MKVAVIGGGITGMAAAQRLQGAAEVTLFEAQARLGGHTDTHNLFVDGRSYAIDSGFIAFNDQNYPQFAAWLESLGVTTRATSMSFGVSLGSAAASAAPLRTTRTEYGTADLGALFSDRRNLVNPRFLRMLVDINRFYRESRKLNALHQAAELPTASMQLGDFLKDRRFGDGFVHEHLLPLCMALWSTSIEGARALPLGHVLSFMDQHKLLQMEGRPSWRVIEGGSNRYVSAFVDRFEGELRLFTPISKVLRTPGTVRVVTPAGEERFDRVVFACHADQALALIEPTALEAEVLGSFHYDAHRAVVHSDQSFMPASERAWSSWNVVGPRGQDAQLTYWMNRLQPLASNQHFFVTLNPRSEPQRVWAERSYEHPAFTPDVQRAQTRRDEINGVNLTSFAGAYWRYGTHEDGFVSGMEVAERLLDASDVAVSA